MLYLPKSDISHIHNLVEMSINCCILAMYLQHLLLQQKA